jgi:SAM-dependent methyltransferase
MSHGSKNWFQMLEQRELDQVLIRYSGCDLLFIGGEASRVAKSPASNHILAINPDELMNGNQSIPLIEGSIDVIVVSHWFDYYQPADQFLARLKALLKPDGLLVILGYNPHRCLGQQLVRAQNPNVTFAANSSFKMARALNKKGFHIELIRHYGFYPFQNQELLKWFELLGSTYLPSLGAGYLICAKKCDWALKPIKVKWNWQLEPNRPSVVSCRVDEKV